MVYRRFLTSPCFIWSGSLQGRCWRDVDELYHSRHGFSPEINRQVTAPQHTLGHFNNIFVLSFNNSILLGSVGSREIPFDAYSLTIGWKIMWGELPTYVHQKGFDLESCLPFNCSLELQKDDEGVWLLFDEVHPTPASAIIHKESKKSVTFERAWLHWPAQISINELKLLLALLALPTGKDLIVCLPNEHSSQSPSPFIVGSLLTRLSECNCLRPL